MTMAYIRKAYGVPAKRGGRISYWVMGQKVAGRFDQLATLG